MTPKVVQYLQKLKLIDQREQHTQVLSKGSSVPTETETSGLGPREHPALGNSKGSSVPTETETCEGQASGAGWKSPKVVQYLKKLKLCRHHVEHRVRPPKVVQCLQKLKRQRASDWRRPFRAPKVVQCLQKLKLDPVLRGSRKGCDPKVVQCLQKLRLDIGFLGLLMILSAEGL